MSAEGHRSGIILIHKTDMAGVRTITIQPVNDASGKGFFSLVLWKKRPLLVKYWRMPFPALPVVFQGSVYGFHLLSVGSPP